MQRIYRFVFGNIYKVTGRLDETLRTVCLYFCCFFITGVFFTDRSGWEINAGRDMIIGSMLLIAISVLSIDKEPGEVRWNRWVCYSMIAFGLGMLIVGRLHPVGDGYVMYSLDLAFVFPAYYYARINNGKEDQLYRMIALCTVAWGVLSFIYCWLEALQGRLPLREDNRFTGYLNDPNILGMLGVVIFVSALYLLFEYRREWIAVLSAAGVGIGMFYAFMTASRTSVLCEMICITAFVIFVLKEIRTGAKDKSNLIKGLICAVIMSLVIIAAGTKMDDINLHAIQKNNGPVSHIEIVVPVEAEDDTAEETESDPISITDRPDPSDGLDVYTSGRIGIWKIYIDNFSWLGRDLGEIEDQFEGMPAYRAHNNIIDYTFRCGYIVGGLYLIFFISAGISGLMILFDRRYTRPEYFFLVSIIGSYSIQALLEIATLPFSRCIPCLFFMTISPIMGRIVKENRKETDSVR